MNQEQLQRLEIARLFHRFGFGPKPGEFAAAISQGAAATRSQLLTVPQSDKGLASIREPQLTDLGKFPPPGTTARAAFATEMRRQRRDLAIWWLDRMALADNALTERMTWFWHGHWATSIGKVEYALPMYLQNQRLRANALGNFADQARAMILDGALQYWLDGGDNTVTAPNENLAREFMELFTLGVDRYFETDVQTVARALTGYRVVRSNGAVTFNPKNHDSSKLAFLGTSGTFTAEKLSDFIVSRDDCAQFIAERIWYRFISDTSPLPEKNGIKTSFAKRDIASAIRATATSSAISDLKYSQVKPPIDWFISVCRALRITPSKLSKPDQALNFLDKLGQVPFSPPNVGGWPAGEAWLTAGSAQYRLQIAQILLAQGDLSSIKQSPIANRVDALADLLGVPLWSARTQSALESVTEDPARIFLLGVSTPEYLVSL
ncbi:MAG: DUF1800 family protein [Actinobacteria bacterium]|nr:DUF1800 family protein [Actinomycetota bacterium]